MFCPEDFVSLHELIEDAHSDSSFKESSKRLISRLLEDSGLEELAYWLVRLHPLRDIVENIVFEEAYNIGLWVCSPSGQTLKLRMPFHQVDYAFDELVRYVQSYGALEEFDDLFSEPHDLYELKSRHYELKRFERLGKDKENYNHWMANAWLKRNSRVPLYFNRTNYTVSTFIYDRLRSTHQMHWTPEGLGVGDDGPVLRQMNGYSLCVRESDRRSLSPKAIHQKLGEVIYSHLVGEDVASTESVDDDDERKGGRPNKSDEAARLVLDHFGANSFPTFKEAVRFLETEHDIRVHKRTLQRGLKRISGDKT